MGSIFFFIVLFIIFSSVKNVNKHAKDEKQKYNGNAPPNGLSPEQQARLEALAQKYRGQAGKRRPPPRTSYIKRQTLGQQHPSAAPALEETAAELESWSVGPPTHDGDSLFWEDEEIWNDDVSAMSDETRSVHTSKLFFEEAPQKATLFEQGSRLKGNSRLDAKPPLIAPPRPAEPSLAALHPPEMAVELTAEEEAATGRSYVLPKSDFQPQSLRRAMVMSEVLKRPRFGVAPRYR